MPVIPVSHAKSDEVGAAYRQFVDVVFAGEFGTVFDGMTASAKKMFADLKMFSVAASPKEISGMPLVYQRYILLSRAELSAGELLLLTDRDYFVWLSERLNFPARAILDGAMVGRTRIDGRIAVLTLQDKRGNEVRFPSSVKPFRLVEENGKWRMEISPLVQLEEIAVDAFCRASNVDVRVCPLAMVGSLLNRRLGIELFDPLM